MIGCVAAWLKSIHSQSNDLLVHARRRFMNFCRIHHRCIGNHNKTNQLTGLSQLKQTLTSIDGICFFLVRIFGGHLMISF
jgi:hypothetical protein